MKKLVSIVVPCYNEEGNINMFFDNVKDMANGLKYDFEVLFVNDGSSDATFLQLKKLKPVENIDIKIINFSRNFGKEPAMYAGFENSKGDFVVNIDADMQQDPHLIKKMLEIVESNEECDSVCYYQKERKESKTITALKDKFYKIVNKSSEISFVNGASDFRLFKRNVIDEILKVGDKVRFSKGIFSWVGFNTYYLPYKASQRAHGSSKWSIRKLFHYALDGIISFSTMPLKISYIIGIACLLLDFIYLIAKLIMLIAFNISFTSYFGILFIILLLSGIQFLILGVIGEYIGRIYSETKKRPLYVAKDIIVNGKVQK